MSVTLESSSRSWRATNDDEERNRKGAIMMIFFSLELPCNLRGMAL